MNGIESNAAAAALKNPIDWAQASCDALMAKYRPEQLPPEGRWHYHQGIFLYGMLKVWEATGNEAYLVYAKEYVDKLIDEYGSFKFARDELDAMMPGLLLFPLHAEFGEERYRIAAAKLRGMFHTLNRTSEGGFWHKDKYPYQMWLDGLYMGGVFAMQYARYFGEADLFDMVLYQESLMRRHMTDERTGLLFHAWDESRSFPWADEETGCSPEFWGRSLGWYGMALADFLDELPPEHPGREVVKAALRPFVEALIRYQDSATGLWYQVVDKGSEADNWLETSCTSLFIYTIAKAIRYGAVGEECRAAAERAYQGLIGRTRTDEFGLVVPEICIGTSAGDYTNYVTRPVSENDLHGVGAFILACAEMQKLQGLQK
ncbi:YteR2 [Paenibacillus mucilaginosus 3016]|uniref:YteR2 n=2 Tax=Paenibacillus mucilaginosus TaxID=61624 RepID=H6NGK1_9BACL|nr:glycoside hydrolase family 88 protein [Paenibacillus mucilaginosus]AFC33904.1 YteR2 [Paenibacillus mucilaginosus 3016]AFH66237.1 glycosyl hydrolase family 88 [Paenibacillus mucilaginosus K02]WFA22281.1 glycoside hydrolase 105 family protein [Paenibacillus mucilaginosus]